MVQPALPLVQSYHPTTFLERGVAVPFTTPLLAGTRVRPSVRGGADLVVPNPSGGRGVYILPWHDVRALCSPTLHDRRMNEAVAALPFISPSSVRGAARQVAAGGLAGQPARDAAAVFLSASRREHTLTNYLLLMQIITWAGQCLPDQAGGGDLEHRAKQAVMLIAGELGQEADTVAASLDTLATAFSGVGLPGQEDAPRIPRLLRSLRQTMDGVADWRGACSDSTVALCADIVVAGAGLAIDCASAALAAARSLTDDIAVLLRDWSAAPDAVAGLAARPDWLLDGWDQICALWVDAGQAGHEERTTALVEMALLVPVMPREAASWLGSGGGAVDRDRSRVHLNEDWRTGTAAFRLIERNERLRAMAA